MSSTNRGAVRDLDDYYATPPQLTLRICRQLQADYHLEPVNILEPGCGAGSFLVAAREVWPEADVHGLELSPDLADKARDKGFSVWVDDVLTADLPDYSLIIGNPPFKHADQFIRRLIPHLDHDFGRLAFLLRLNFLGGRERYASLWRAYPPEHIYVMPARPGFTADGRSDSIEYMVAVWRWGPGAGRTTMSFLDNLGVENKWRPGAYEDPRRVWFPQEAQAAPVGQQILQSEVGA